MAARVEVGGRWRRCRVHSFDIAGEVVETALSSTFREVSFVPPRHVTARVDIDGDEALLVFDLPAMQPAPGRALRFGVA